MSSLDGEVLVRGTSEWVLMSPETRQFVSLAGVYEPPENLIEERNFEKKQRKIRDFDTSDAVPYVVVPPYTAADINGHVNNSVYADYPFDATTRVQNTASRASRSTSGTKRARAIRSLSTPSAMMA